MPEFIPKEIFEIPNLKDLKTFNYFICHLLYRTIERDPEGYIRKQIFDEIGENWTNPELIKIEYDASGCNLRIVFNDGKQYNIRVQEHKER